MLDLSKTIMYRFHYDYMQPKYGNKVQLDYMDTDNLAYEIETEDFNKDIAKDVVTRFDTNVWKKSMEEKQKVWKEVLDMALKIILKSVECLKVVKIR